MRILLSTLKLIVGCKALVRSFIVIFWNMDEHVVNLEITYEDSKFIYLVLKALIERVIDK